jgi:hypothetical protein
LPIEIGADRLMHPVIGGALLQRKFLFLALEILIARTAFTTLWPRFFEVLPSGYGASGVAEFFRHRNFGQFQESLDLGAALGH